MHVAKRIALALLILPAAEILVFVLAVAAIGFWKTMLLTLATSVAGGIVLSRVGREHVPRFRAALARGGGMTGPEAMDGYFTGLGGFLLVLPGFVTDVLGALLLVPWLRQPIGTRLVALLRTRGKRPDAVLDLDPAEWTRHPDRPVRHVRRRRSGR